MEARTRRGTQGVRRKGEQESPENVRQTRRVPGNEEREESEQEVKGPGVHRQEDPLSGEVERLEPDECLVELERSKLAEVARCKEKLRRGQAQQVQEQGRTPARTGRRHLPGQPKQSEALHKAGGEAQQPALALQESAPELPGQMDANRVSGGTYATDPSHTLVAWSVNHFGFNDYYGAFGDVEGTPGRSLFVRLTGPESGKGAAGKWTDAATGEHGDLLDLIAGARQLRSFGETLDEARIFLNLPRPEPPTRERVVASTGSPEAARRLFAMGRPIGGTLAERCLHRRGLSGLGDAPALRFHPCCYYWREGQPKDSPPETWPALLAKVTDLNGNLTGVHRTWLDPATARKAPLDPPRKAMGHLLGHGVRVGIATDILTAGEGLESTLSLRMALPDLPVIAALSANHLAALILPAGLRRLYIAADADEAGAMAADKLTERADAVGIETIRQNKVHLQGSTLPITANRITQHKLQFWSIKCTFARIQNRFKLSCLGGIAQSCFTMLCIALRCLM
mgnify:CR=1 FL=1